MGKLQIFKNTEFGFVRIITVDGEPYFVAKDVTGIFGYANVSKSIVDHVDEEDKINNESLSRLGQRGGGLINESSLYSLDSFQQDVECEEIQEMGSILGSSDYPQT